MTEQVKAMKQLGFTDEEIADVLECDKRIDKGEKLFELTPDQKQIEKKMRQADRKAAPNYEFSKRERKADNDKQFLIQTIAASLPCEPEIVNAEREIIFKYNDKKYKIILSAPRS